MVILKGICVVMWYLGCTSVKVFMGVSSLSGTAETPQKYEGGLATGAALTSHSDT